MRFVDQYRDPALCAGYIEEIRRTVTGPRVLMEVCGGQTHTILRYGLDELLGGAVTLIHGPGCPVCVTPGALIDAAVRLALTPGVILCSFGDMLRVPGGDLDLISARAQGGDVRIVYSPFDAVQCARSNPDSQVVMFAVGFETTAPATAAALMSAGGLENFSMICAHVLVPPAMEAVLSMEECGLQGFLAAGHVCTVTGLKPYHGIVEKHSVPVVVSGFEPADILQAVLMCVRQLEAGRCRVENQYTRSVKPEGNPIAMKLVEEVFSVTDREWRGMGVIPGSGLVLSGRWRDYDALERFGIEPAVLPGESLCMAGKVLTGGLRPPECPYFGGRCTPEKPMGAPMVSSEGACAAHYRYGGRG